jgi:hypothetical protein
MKPDDEALWVQESSGGRMRRPSPGPLPGVRPSGRGGGPSGKHQPAELAQRAQVDPPLEIDHVVDRLPPVHPAPAVELGSIAAIEAHALLVGHQPEQEPALLLADTHRLAVPPDIAPRQPVSQPAARRAEHADILPRQPDLLLELAEHRFPGALARQDPALRKLPAGAAGPPGPEDMTRVVREDDADVGPEAVLVYAILHWRP